MYFKTIFHLSVSAVQKRLNEKLIALLLCSDNRFCVFVIISLPVVIHADPRHCGGKIRVWYILE